MPTDVTQAGVIVNDQTPNADVTQGGVIVYGGPEANVTQGGVIVYEAESTAEVTQAGVIVFETGQTIDVTQGGVLQFIEGLHRNPELIVAALGATSATLQVRFIYEEWMELQYAVDETADNFTSPFFNDTRDPNHPDFANIVLTGLTTGVSYTARVRALSSAGYTVYATVEFTPVAQLLPSEYNIFSVPGHGEPVATDGDKSDLTSIQFCWDRVFPINNELVDIGEAVELLIADPFVGTFTQIADENDLVGLQCINRPLSSFVDGWYIAKIITRDEFGVEREWYHPGFLIDRLNLSTYYDQAPVNLDDWTIRAGVTLPWAIQTHQSVCNSIAYDKFGRRFRQFGDPNSFVNGPTIIGPVFPGGLKRARASATGSIWAYGTWSGYFFGGEGSEVSVYSAVGNGFNVKAHVGYFIIGPVGFGDSTGVALAAEFSVVVSVDPGIFGVAGSTKSFTHQIRSAISHPCLFTNNNPPKWPLHLFVEHEWVDLAAGLVHVRGFLGAPYNLTIDEVVDVGFDMTTLECNCVGLGRFKIDNFQNDPGFGQFDNFMYWGDPGDCVDTCGISPIPIPECPPDDPDCNPTPEPDPEIPLPPPPVVECPVVIFNIESSNVLFFGPGECPPGSILAFIDDSGNPVVFVDPCPPPGVPDDGGVIVPEPPPVIIVRTGRANLTLPQFTLLASGNASTPATFGESFITLPILELEAEGEVLLEGDLDVDIPNLELESEGDDVPPNELFGWGGTSFGYDPVGA